MRYIVKWKRQGIAQAVMFPGRFASVTDAIPKAACPILEKRRDDVWIKDETGVMIVNAAQLAEYCDPV